MNMKRPGLLQFALAIPMLIRGVDRIHDGHPLSGWLMAASGTILLAVAIGRWRRAR